MEIIEQFRSIGTVTNLRLIIRINDIIAIDVLILDITRTYG